jgi:hypothetical protein
MACIAHALRHSIPYYIPSFVKSKYTRNNPFDQFPLLTSELEAQIQYEYYDKGWEYTPIPQNGKNTRLHGYFQNLNYYDEYRAQLIQAFNLPPSIRYNECAIHIRLGDFKHQQHKWPVMPPSYFEQAIALMRSNGINKFTVYSDEIDVAKDYLPYGEYTFMSKDALTDWIELSQYEHHILPNSTYSYSSAYLKRGSGITICPKAEDWYGPMNQHIYNKEFIPLKWIII